MSNKVRLLLVGLAVVVIAVLAWFFLLDPLRGDIAAAEDQIEEEQARLSQAQTRLAQAEATREEGRRNQARLLELAKIMPASDEVPSLLLQIQDLADQSGIDFIAITPGDSQESGVVGYKILPLELEFRGTFFDVSDFVYRAEQMVAGPGRLLAVKDLQLGLADSGDALAGKVSPKLTVSMTMYAFVAEPTAKAAGTTQSAQTTGSNATTSTTNK